MVTRQTGLGFVWGIVMGVLLIGCAGFSYHYYGLWEVVYDHGMLLGPNEKEDLPFSKCAPTDAIHFPCVIMFSKDFFAMKQDYEDTKQKLKECQKP